MGDGPETKDIPFSKRTIRPNPIVQSRDVVKDRRRDIFFKKIQQDREDQRWASRSDQILRLEFISQQKRWEAEKARQAPNIDGQLEDYVIDAPSFNSLGTRSPQQSQTQWTEGKIGPEEEFDQILERENLELDALVSMMETNESRDSSSQHYGSDEDDYDSLFMEFLTAPEKAQCNTITYPIYEDDAMDLSQG